MIVYKGKSYHPTKIWRLLKTVSQDGHILLIYYDSPSQSWACQKLGALEWCSGTSAYAAVRQAMENSNLIEGKDK